MPFSALLNPAILTPIACFLYFLAKYRSAGYLTVGSVVLAGYLLLYFRWENLAKLPLGTVVLILTGIALPALGFWQFQQFADLGDPDHSAYAFHLWNLRHGILHYSYRGMNMLGIHSQYTSVLWIPVQWLAGEPGLKLGNGLCLIAAALLLVRRQKGNRNAAAWGAAAILISPPVASQFFYGFHPELIAAPALVLALDAYRDGKLARFLFWTFFMAFSKEVFTLAVGGILLVALLERRNWKWILLPGLLCCALIGIYWFLVVPEFAPKGNDLEFLMPTSKAQIVRDWLRPTTLAYFLHIYAPLLPLLWIMPKRYWLMPVPLMIFYTAFPDPAFLVMWVNYGFPLTLLCAGGLILKGDLEFRDGDAPEEASPSPAVASSLPTAPISVAKKMDGRILAACFIVSLLSYPLWREAFSIPAPNPSREAFNRIKALLPDDASAVINGPFIARFTARKRAEAWGWNKRPLEDYDYVVMDSTYKPAWFVDAKGLAAGIEHLATSPEWTLEYGRGNLLLFKHNRYSGAH